MLSTRRPDIRPASTSLTRFLRHPAWRPGTRRRTAAPTGTIVQSFWHGGALSPYENLCIQSFLDHGHAYHLYTYDPALPLPKGTVRCAAEAILPQSEIFLGTRGVSRGSIALFADRFRYELLRRSGGWWVDTDVVCLSRALPDDPVFVAFEKPDKVNCAIMRFPPDHPVMRGCLEETVRLGTDVPWGATGPRLLTAMLKREGLLDKAAPPTVCYPFDWDEVPLLYDPATTADLQERTRDSPMIHLWNEMIRRAAINKFVGVPEGSFLAGLFATHRIAFPARPHHTTDDIRRLDDNRRGDDKLVGTENKVTRLEAKLRERDTEIAALRKALQEHSQPDSPPAGTTWPQKILRLFNR